MRVLVGVVALSLAVFAGAVGTAAQEGHPLKGSWIGEWGPAKTHSNDMVLILNWDGKSITGTLNPGVDDVPIKNATLNPEGWLFRFEADVKDSITPSASVGRKRTPQSTHPDAVAVALQELRKWISSTAG